MTRHSEINKAFETYLSMFLSEEELRKIRARFGDEVTAAVEAIYKEAIDCPVDWGIDAALPVLRNLLDSKYPWLSSKARSNIINAFVMNSK